MSAPKAVRVRTSTGWQDIALTGPAGPQGQGVPVGAPIPWLVSTIPSGYLEFNGQAISQANYPQLYALFGGNLPDLRDKFLLGASGTYGVGTTGGEVNHALSIAELATHNHSTPAHTHTGEFFANLSPSNLGGNTAAPPGGSGSPPVDVTHSGGGGTSGNAGSGAAHNNMPPYRAVRWITIAG
jgi:microcystin-dependent protein